MSQSYPVRGKIILCVVILLLFTSITTAHKQQMVHFGDNIILLRFQNDQLFSSQLSPYGTYVVAHVATYMGVVNGIATNDFSFEGSANQYLWDLRKHKLDASVISLNPDGILGVNSSAISPVFAFHPDEEFLATANAHEIQLLTLPSLQVQHSLSVEDEGTTEPILSVSWSLDGSLLAALVNHKIIVWSKETDTVGTYTLAEAYDTIQATRTGWFVDARFDPDVQSFTTCAKHLESCRIYENQPPYSRLSPDREIMFTKTDVYEHQKVDIWRVGENGEYRLGDQLLIPDPFCARFFSPDNQTIASLCVNDWTFWDVERSEVSYSLPGGHLTWLPDNKHLVWLSGIVNPPVLRLYRFGQTELVDELILESIPGMEDIRRWLFDGDYDIRDVSIDGRWVLINLGWGALVVPIESEEN